MAIKKKNKIAQHWGQREGEFNRYGIDLAMHVTKVPASVLRGHAIAPGGTLVCDISSLSAD